MNEELLKEIKTTLPWLLVAAIGVGGYYGVKNHLAEKRAAAAETVAAAYTAEELEDAVVKFKSAKAEGVLKLRLAKAYYDAGRFQQALELYDGFDAVPGGLEGVPAVGRAACLEALEKFDEAAKAYDDFVAANGTSFLKLTAQLGAARCISRAGRRPVALERLAELKKSVAGDPLAEARIDSTVDLVTRYEKRAEVSLFDAADAAAQQLEKMETPAVPAPAPAKTE